MSAHPTLLEQCQRWHDEDQFQAIIDAIEALPAAARTPEFGLELARAYNNRCVMDFDGKKPELLRKAISLLKAHEAHFTGDHKWHFRLGYAYYYLDQEPLALPQFRAALEALPEDEDTQELIELCERNLRLPTFRHTFQARVHAAWKAFAEDEATLRQLIDQQTADPEELVERCRRALEIALNDVTFELGFNGQRHELILSPEGQRHQVFMLHYFQRHAPQSVLAHWNILIGRQRHPAIDQFKLRQTADGFELTAQDLQVWLHRDDEQSKSVSIALYCEKLLPMMAENESHAYWILANLLDQALGELCTIAHVDMDMLQAPQDGAPITLAELPTALENMGIDLNITAAQLLERYAVYQHKPDSDPNGAWRQDIYVGNTLLPSLIHAYQQADPYITDDFHLNGAVLGFIAYPLERFQGDNAGKEVLDFRDALTDAIQQQVGDDGWQVIGGATGQYYGYLDFIAWDSIIPICHTAVAFFAEHNMEDAFFRVFRRDVEALRLDSPDDQDDSAENDTEDSEDGDIPTGNFIGFVLLDHAHWDKAQFLRDMQEKWDINLHDEVNDNSADGEQDKDILVTELDGTMISLALMSAPVPNDEAVQSAGSNYLWPEAEATARTHCAHLLVTVMGAEDGDVLARGTLYAKILAACCRQPHALGIFTSGTVFQPAMYEDFADMTKEGIFPLYNLVWFGLYRSENGMSAYTDGLRLLGKEEMEILDSALPPNELREKLSNIAAYVLENDITLQDGETLGSSEEDKHPITRSEGVALPGMTLKIAY